MLNTIQSKNTNTKSNLESKSKRFSLIFAGVLVVILAIGGILLTQFKASDKSAENKNKSLDEIAAETMSSSSSQASLGIKTENNIEIKKQDFQKLETSDQLNNITKDIEGIINNFDTSAEFGQDILNDENILKN